METAPRIEDQRPGNVLGVKAVKKTSKKWAILMQVLVEITWEDESMKIFGIRFVKFLRDQQDFQEISIAAEIAAWNPSTGFLITHSLPFFGLRLVCNFQFLTSYDYQRLPYTLCRIVFIRERHKFKVTPVLGVGNVLFFVFFFTWYMVWFYTKIYIFFVINCVLYSLQLHSLLDS